MSSLFFTDIKMECSQISDLFGKVLHIQIRSTRANQQPISVPRCGFYDGSEACNTCIKHLRNLFSGDVFYIPGTIITLKTSREDLPSNHTFETD